MGQATVDLPDPLEAPPPSSLSGTDDLLAQLAGDEIDRLLAEADAEHKPPAAPPPPLPTSSTAAVDTVVPQSIDPAPVVPADVADAALPQAAGSPAAAAPASVPGDDELDALLSQLSASGASALPASTPPSMTAPAEPTPPATVESKSLLDRVPEILAQFPPAAEPTTAEKSASASTSATTVPAVSLPASAAAADAADGVMSAAERAALKSGELTAESDAQAFDAAEAEATSPAGRLGPIVKLLEILNAPLSFVPDALRDTLGKAAIVTLVNSIAVLVYVLFVRH